MADERIGGAYIEIGAEQARGEPRRTLNRIEREADRRDINLEIDVDTEYTEQQLRDFVDDMEDMEIDIPVDVFTSYARARLSWLARDRLVSIIPTIDTKAYMGVATALAALSGGRSAWNWIDNFTTSIKNLDKNLPRLASMVTLITNLSSAAGAGISNILGIGGGLASIIPLGLALPGVLGGVAGSVAILSMAFADMGDVLGDLGPAFGRLQDQVSSNFWAEAEGPIRSMVDSLLPALSTGLGAASTEMGKLFGAIANTIGSTEGIAAIESILSNLTGALDIAGDGAGAFTSALLGLASVGSEFLEPLAGAFNDMSYAFEDWVQKNTENGNIYGWIETAGQNLKELGGIVWGLGGIFSNLHRAATRAGAADLADLHAGIDRVNKALEGPAWQGALTTVFKGAHDAMEALGPGFASLADGFKNFAPTLAEIMVLAGEIGSVFLDSFGEILSNSAFQNGLTDFFEGVLSGVEAIRPHVPALAEAFGAVASFAGTLASVLGPVLGATIEALSPVVVDIMEALEAVAPVLGEVLVGAIETVAPLIQDVVGFISDWIKENPGLAATIGAIVAAIGGLIVGAIAIVTALAPVVSAIMGIVSAGAGMGLTFGGIASAIGAVLGPIALVIAAIAAIVGAFIYAWNSSEQFREAIAGLGEAILGFMEPIIEFIQTTVFPVVEQIVGAFLDMVTQILDALVPFWTVMVEIWTEIIKIMTPVVGFILDVLAPIFEHLGNVVSAVFDFIGTVISNAIDIITSILQVFLKILQGDWKGAWEAVKNVARVIWDSLKENWSAFGDLIKRILSSFLDTVKSVWNRVWGGIRDFAVNLWNSLVSRITTFVANLAHNVTSKVNEIRDKVRDGFERARQLAVDAFKRLVQGSVDKINELLRKVRELPGDIKSRLGNLKDLLLNSGKDLIRGLINGIKDMAGRAVDAAKGVVGDAVNGAKNLLGINSPSKVFMEIGQNTGEGYVLGLERMARDARRAAEMMVDPPTGRVQAPQGSIGARPTAGISSADMNRLMSMAGSTGNRTVNVTAPDGTNDPGVWGERIADTLDLHDLVGEVALV